MQEHYGMKSYKQDHNIHVPQYLFLNTLYNCIKKRRKRERERKSRQSVQVSLR